MHVTTHLHIWIWPWLLRSRCNIIFSFKYVIASSPPAAGFNLGRHIYLYAIHIHAINDLLPVRLEIKNFFTKSCPTYELRLGMCICLFLFCSNCSPHELRIQLYFCKIKYSLLCNCYMTANNVIVHLYILHLYVK